MMLAIMFVLKARSEYPHRLDGRYCLWKWGQHTKGRFACLVLHDGWIGTERERERDWNKTKDVYQYVRCFCRERGDIGQENKREQEGGGMLDSKRSTSYMRLRNTIITIVFKYWAIECWIDSRLRIIVLSLSLSLGTHCDFDFADTIFYTFTLPVFFNTLSARHIRASTVFSLVVCIRLHHASNQGSQAKM